MAGLPTGRLAAFRRMAVKRDIKAKGPRKDIAQALGISLSRVYSIAQSPYMESKPERTRRFVSKALYYTKATKAQIAARAGITARHMRKIAKRDGIKRKYPLKTGPKLGSKKPRITQQQLERIVLLGGQGVSQRKIAKDVNVTQPEVSQVLKKHGRPGA